MKSLEKVNILLVDDQPAKLLTHESILSQIGENLVKARSGREALECLLRDEFAVILLDVNMPEMNGFETAAMIRQRPCLERTPIIFITGYSTTDIDRMKGYDIGAVDYLFLPVLPEVLKAKVQVFVELAKQKQIIKRQAEDLALQNQQQQEQIHLIQNLNERLQTANEELESFSYSVSHDLRAPLRALQGYSHLLLEEQKERLTPEGQDYLRRINRAAKRMDALTQDILAYSRVARHDFMTLEVDLEAVLNDLLIENPRIKQIQPRIHVRTPLEKVVGHEACLTQCLSNLIENAIKFVSPGTVPEITIRTEKESGLVRIWVEDNGIGIDELYQERIFRMFERGHSGTGYDGTGIGLTIVKKAVEKMGGAVGVKSRPGAGSKFWLELPAGGS